MAATPTKLGAAIAGNAKATPASRFMAALAGKRPLRKIAIPILDVAAAMTLLGTERTLDIEGEVLAIMARRGLPQNELTEQRYELERAVRYLADAVREDDAEKGAAAAAFGTVEEWGKLPPAAIGELWAAYGDLCEEHDPLEVEPSAEVLADIREAIAKKNGTLLRYCGVRRLAAYLLTSVDPPASSETPRSSPGPSSPGSSSPPVE